MRYAIMSDIHANREALVAVLAAIDREAPDVILTLGDIVGYGPAPADCIHLLQERGVRSVIGNHDSAVAGLMSASFFNYEARCAVAWTQEALAAADLAYLRELPLTLAGQDFTAFHGTLVSPEGFDYILSLAEAEMSLAVLPGDVGFHGHSHMPCVFLEEDGRTSLQELTEITLTPGRRALINAGSVGQPRDGAPAAAFTVYDAATRTCRLRRVDYNVARTVEEIVAAGLPEINAYRLLVGR